MMRQSRANFLVLSLLTWLFVPVGGSHAAIVVFGVETSPGSYTFTFEQQAGTDPIQTKGFIPLNFAFDASNFTVTPGSPTGTISDGTVDLTPALTGWSDPTGTASAFDPNLIAGGTTITAASSTTGIDFATVEVNWRFTSAEFFGGTPLTGRVMAVSSIPEPSTFGLLALTSATLMMTRRRRSKQAAKLASSLRPDQRLSLGQNRSDQ